MCLTVIIHPATATLVGTVVLFLKHFKHFVILRTLQCRRKMDKDAVIVQTGGIFIDPPIWLWTIID
jgi:hypothetical protein